MYHNRQFSVWQAIFKSFHSKELYQDVGRNWSSQGALTLLIILAFIWIPYTAQIHMQDMPETERELAKMVKDIPRIEIRNGQVHTAAPMPYTIYDQETGAPMLIIDTTGEVTSLSHLPKGMLLTRNQLFIKNNEYQTRSYDLTGIDEFYVDQQRLEGWISVIRHIAAIVIYPFAVLGVYAYRLIQGCIYALVGLLFANILKVELRYSAIIQMTYVALTPMLILDAVKTLLNLEIPLWTPICITLVLVYLFYGMKANQEEDGQINEENPALVGSGRL